MGIVKDPGVNWKDKRLIINLYEGQNCEDQSELSRNEEQSGKKSQVRVLPGTDACQQTRKTVR